MILKENFKDLEEIGKYLTLNEIQKAIIRKTIVEQLEGAESISGEAYKLSQSGVFNGENKTFFSLNGIRSIFYNNKKNNTNN